MMRKKQWPQTIAWRGLIFSTTLLLPLLLCSSAGSRHRQMSQTTTERQAEPVGMTQLEVGKPIERELKSGQTHAYAVTLAAGQYFHAIAEQRGIDVVVAVIGPDGQQLAEIDSPNGAQGPEPVMMVAESSGVYRLLVRPVEKDAATGRYEMRIVELRAATDDDRARQEANRLDQQVGQSLRAGKYDAARPLAERALALREKLPLDRLSLAQSLHNLAEICRATGEYAQAVPLYQRALTLEEAARGADHPLVATILNNLAGLYQRQGQYAQAEPLYRRALTLREKLFGAEHPQIAASLNNLANLYLAQGLFEQAETVFKRALAMAEKTRGPQHPDVASTLNGLGILYRQTGEYGKAELLYQRALAIVEKARGPHHHEVALSLNNLAGVYLSQGETRKAAPLLLRALAIDEQALGPQHLQFPATLNNLMVLYKDLGDYAQAADYARRALAVWEKALGAQHHLVATALNNLASVHYQQGDYALAISLHQRALAIEEQALGAEHPNVAVSLNNLATNYQATGQYAQAEPLLLRAVTISEKALGVGHRDVAKYLSNTAALYRASGNMPQAIAFQVRSNEARERDLARNLAVGSERQKLVYLNLSTGDTDATLSLHLQSAPNDATARNLALTTLLRRKGRALDAMTDTIAVLRRHALPEDRALLDQYAAARDQLSAATLRGPGKAGAAAHQTQLLEARLEQIESQLSARRAEFRAQSATVTLNAVQQAIPTGAALIEFASYRPVNPQEPRRAARAHYGPPRYVAYLLRREGEAQWVELGAAQPIDQAVGALRQALRDPQRADVKRLARQVDEQVMRPIRQRLGPTRHLLLSPDGALNLLPFAALVDENQRYLIQRYAFTYLTSGRDLLRLAQKIPSQQQAVIIANPAFSEPTATIAAREASSVRSFDFGQVYFPPIPATEDEARALQALFPEATLLTKEQATEAALKQVAGPTLLHIATHGFFLEDLASASTPERGPVSREARSNVQRLENPLLRSGLALAGANQRKSGDEDGILTAAEAATLNLWGTKLVVLSACNTGVGEVRNGEGVYGLRRALVLAGSETQVMSLWPVSDKGTRELMINYYRGLQAGGGRGAALRQAQLKLRARAVREHPYFWAGFIQSGEWANLAGER